MMMHVIGFTANRTQEAIDLGIAMQLTNILRDVGEDLGKDRIYLPLDELGEYGYRIEDLAARRCDERFRRLMEFQCRRARATTTPARPASQRFRPTADSPSKSPSKVYSGILDRIESGGYDVFDRRHVVPKAHKYWITARALAVPMLRRCIS